jgi:hypothetical protein
VDALPGGELRLADVVDLHDIRILHARDRTGFREEAHR